MARKISSISLFLMVISSLFIPNASSATPITDFDGTYAGNFTITVTVTVPTNPPQKISNTSTAPIQLSVNKGVIVGWAKGSVINKAGKAIISVDLAPYGKLTLTSYFAKNASTGVMSVSGTLSGSFPAARSVISGKFIASGRDRFIFSIPSILPAAKIGKKYPVVNFCNPVPPKGQMCGPFFTPRNPSGGKPPYTFKLRAGSDFLPTGLVLNSRTGELSGTPKAGQAPVTKKLIICAYDSNDRFTGVCRTTTMVLTK